MPRPPQHLHSDVGLTEVLLGATGPFDDPRMFQVVRADLGVPMDTDVGPSVNDEEAVSQPIIEVTLILSYVSSKGKAGASCTCAAGCSGAVRAPPRCRTSEELPPSRWSTSSSSPRRSSPHSTARTSPRQRPCDRLVAAARRGGAPPPARRAAPCVCATFCSSFSRERYACASSNHPSSSLGSPLP